MIPLTWAVMALAAMRFQGTADNPVGRAVFALAGSVFFAAAILTAPWGSVL